MSKSTFQLAISPRFTRSRRTPTPSSPSVAGSARNQSGTRPRSSSAPSVMSPAMPLKGSRMAIISSNKPMRDAEEEFESLELPAVTGAGAGVEHYHFCVARNQTGGDHLLRQDDGAAALRRRVDAARRREMERCGADLVLRRGERAAVALPD